jgi:hypothetical protein
LEHRGEPTSFFIMTKHIIATTAEASRAIVQRLQRVKLSGFPKKDIGRYSTVVTSIANRLTSCGKLPDYFDEIINKGLMTTTVYALRNYLTILHTTNDIQVKGYK